MYVVFSSSLYCCVLTYNLVTLLRLLISGCSRTIFRLLVFDDFLVELDAKFVEIGVLCRISMVKKKEWLKLLVFLCLMVAVCSKEVYCDEVAFGKFCWNSESHLDDKHCWNCVIKSKNISTNDDSITIVGTLANGSHVNVECVEFVGGIITKIPVMLQKATNRQITQVELAPDKVTVLNAKFFGHCVSLKYFACFKNENLEAEEHIKLSVEGSAFKNCTNLEYLLFYQNYLGTIPFDAFFGLNQLIGLDLWDEKLIVWHSEWFQDLVNLEILNLSMNQLKQIPDEALDKLINLKKLSLYFNKIEKITRNMFQHNNQLELLDLRQNQIKFIQIGSFQHLSKLTWLKLGYNSCTNRSFLHRTPAEIATALILCYPTICLIPAIPNGFVISTADNSTQMIGDSMKNLDSVKVVCNPTYQMFHNKANQTANRCVDQEWKEQQWPQCHSEYNQIKLGRLLQLLLLTGKCSYQEISGISVSADCERNGQEFHCTGHLLPDTKATIRCRYGFEKPKRPINPELTCLASGVWSHKAHECNPVSETVTAQSSRLSEGYCSFFLT